MKIIALSTLTTLLMAAPLSAQANPTEWRIDPSHTEVGFKVRHLMVANVRGAFTKFDAQLTMDEKDVSKSKLSVDIDASSINTKDAKRDEHLRSPDFFDVAKFPKLTFVSTSVKKAGKDKLAVTGDLTIRGVTKSVTLDVVAPEKAIKDPWGNSKRGFEATAKIKREDFGLTWNKALEAGGVLVGSEVTIHIEAEFGQVASDMKS